MKVIFLDRDGVINRYPGHKKYVTKLSEFKFLPGSLKAIKNLTDEGFKIFVISNQAGVSKGFYSQKKLNQITQYMLKKINSSGAKLNGAFYCIHKEENNCLCRKPKTGLIKKALNILKVKRLNKKESFFVGDSIRDVKAGKKAGATTILVLSGRESMRNRKKWAQKPNFIAKDLWEASKIILNENLHNLRLSRPRPQTCG